MKNSFYIKDGTLHHPEMKYFHNTDIKNTIYKNADGFHLHCEVKSWWGGNVLVELFLDEGLGGALIGGNPYYGTYYKGEPILREGRLRMCDDVAGERSHKAVMEIITMFKEYMKKTA